MRLTLVAPSLGAGGAERVVHGLATGFVDAGHDVTVVTTTSRPDFYILPAGVRRTSLDLSGSAPGAGLSPARLPASLGRLRSTVRDLGAAISATTPDLVITFMEDVNVLGLLAAGGRHPVVVTEHNDPAVHTTPTIWRWLRRLTYPRAARLVSVSAGVDEGFGWLASDRRLVIHNPLPVQDTVVTATPLPVTAPCLAAMGRLTRQKGFDLLVEAFARVAPAHPEWSVVVLGEGPDRRVLEADVERRGLSGRVSFVGNRQDVLTDLGGAAFFALTSRWEGFGNAVAEALSVGLPVVSFDCPSGPAEIIDDGRTGVLVPPEDVGALAQALDTMMTDTATRERMAAAAPASVDHLRLDRIVEAWEQQVFPLVTRPSADARDRVRSP